MEITGTVGKISRSGWNAPNHGKMSTFDQHSKGKLRNRCDEIIFKWRWNKKHGVREKSKKHSLDFICHCCK